MKAEENFEEMVAKGIEAGRGDSEFHSLTSRWMELSGRYGYSYRQKFLGVPIIQLPSDIVTIQSLIYDIRPDVIVETGIARGGSLVMSATFLALLDIHDGTYGRGPSKRKVIGIDREIRPHTYAAVQASPFAGYIATIEGDSNADHVVAEVTNLIDGSARVMVFLDSNHTHDHVYRELMNYAKFVSVSSYVVVFDTSIEFDNPDVWANRRPWGRGNSPYSALEAFLITENGRGFEIDRSIDERAEMTVCHSGFLKRLA